MHSLSIGFGKLIRGKGLSKNKPTCENAVSQTLYGSCTLRVMGSCLGYVGRTLEEFVNNSPAARGFQILLAFYQHSVIPEVMKTGSGVNLNFLSNFSQLLLSNICFFRLCCSRLMSGFFVVVVVILLSG